LHQFFLWAQNNLAFQFSLWDQVAPDFRDDPKTKIKKIKK